MNMMSLCLRPCLSHESDCQQREPRLDIEPHLAILLGSAAHGKYAPINRWRLYKIAHCYKRTAPMNQTDSMLHPTGSRRMRPAQTWWAGRSWRADRVGRNRERICRIATRRDAMSKKQSATPAMPGGRAYDDYTPFEPIVWSRSGLCQYVGRLL